MDRGRAKLSSGSCGREAAECKAIRIAGVDQFGSTSGSKQHRRDEARDNLVASIYGWFTEGFGIPDLKRAKAMLEELRLTGLSRSVSIADLPRNDLNLQGARVGGLGPNPTPD